MNIERLKEVVNMERVTSYDKYGISFEAEYSEDILELIDEAIARQSATSEEVAEAIEKIEMLSKAIENDMHWRSDKLMKSLKTAITAMQAYQPTTRKDRTVEEVAISKPETTSCEWCEGNVSKYFDTNWYDFTAKNTGVRPKANYCPNCGRKLKEGGVNGQTRTELLPSTL